MFFCPSKNWRDLQSKVTGRVSRNMYSTAGLEARMRPPSGTYAILDGGVVLGYPGLHNARLLAILFHIRGGNLFITGRPYALSVPTSPFSSFSKTRWNADELLEFCPLTVR